MRDHARINRPVHSMRNQRELAVKNLQSLKVDLRDKDSLAGGGFDENQAFKAMVEFNLKSEVNKIVLI